MSRFFYYLFLINMIVNVVATVPSILFHSHRDGTVSSLIIASIFGLILVLIYTKFFNAYPGMTLPELLQQTTKSWFYKPILLLMATLWFMAGKVTLITFVFLLKRFLTPEIPILQIGLLLVISVVFGCLMKTERVLYTIELIFIITIPFITSIFLYTYTSEDLKWDFVKEAALYFYQMPNFYAFSACLYLFLGVANLAIFNRFFKDKQTFGLKQLSFVFVVAIAAIFTTYFIPIGFNGSEKIGDLIFPWITTSDSIRLRYFVIERLLFVFLLSYLGIAFLSMLIHWHVSIGFLKFVFNFNKMKYKGLNFGPFIPIIIFTVISIYYVRTINEYQLFRYSSVLYNVLAIFLSSMIFLFFFINRRMKYANQKENQN